MRDWEPATYGDRIADIYDELYGDLFDNEGAVTFLAERAGGGPVLELGIGTGRLALPLREKGLVVHGIDSSQSMIDKLRSKAGGDEVAVEIGDFAEVPVDDRYPLIFVAFNTLFALTTQEDQVRCFRNVAEHLTDDGVFVVEAFVPDLTRFRRHQNTEVTDVDVDRAMVDLSRHDPSTQRIHSQHLLVKEGGIEMYPVTLRYVWPAEMDLMAQVAGLTLKERYESWRMAPFNSGSGGHVSVYQKS